MDNDPKTEITLETFEALLDKCGPEPASWPGATRAAALAFAKRSRPAQAALAEAKALDALLDQAPVGDVHGAVKARILETAPGASSGMTGGAAIGARQRGRASAPHGSPGGVIGWLGGFVWPQSGWGQPAALLAACLVAGFYVGLSAPGSFESYDNYDDGDLFAYVFEAPSTWDAGEVQ